MPSMKVIGWVGAPGSQRSAACVSKNDAVDGAAVGEKAARTGFRTADDEDFGFGDGVVADVRALRPCSP